MCEAGSSSGLPQTARAAPAHASARRRDWSASEHGLSLSNQAMYLTLADDFISTIEALMERTVRPDHFPIETPAHASPIPVFWAFDWPLT